MNILFWGSSELSIPFLEDLLNNKSIKIKYVITQPDKPAGRGLKIKSSIVKFFSEKNDLKVLTPFSLEPSEFLDIIEDVSISIVVSYGKIIPQKIIDMHKLGMLNIHFSLLPKYRGAAPIQWCLINGEQITGVTIFWLDSNLDTGDIFLQAEEKVTIDDDFYTLSQRLIKIGRKLLSETIDKILSNQIIRIPQKGEVTYAPLITKKDAVINWSLTSFQIHNLVRALVHWPKASSKIKISDKVLNVKILKTLPLYEKFEKEKLPYGSIIDITKDEILVLCADNTILKILKLQPENKKPLTAREFVCGYRVKKFDKFL